MAVISCRRAKRLRFVNLCVDHRCLFLQKSLVARSGRIFRICRMEYYYFWDIIPKKGGRVYRLLVLRKNLLSWKGRKRFLVLREDLLYRYWNFFFFRILVGKKWSVLFIPPFFFSRNYCMEDFCEEVCYVKGWKRASYIRGSVVWSRYWNIIWKERRMYYFSWKFSCERNLLYERMENLNFLYCNKIFTYIGNFFP